MIFYLTGDKRRYVTNPEDRELPVLEAREVKCLEAIEELRRIEAEIAIAQEIADGIPCLHAERNRVRGLAVELSKAVVWQEERKLRSEN